MRNKDFIPRSDSDLSDWLRAFVPNLAAEYAAFGISAAEMAECESAWQQFKEAYRRTQSYDTRGPLATRQKNLARGEVVAICRRLAAKVRAAGADWPQRFGLGLALPSDDRPKTPNVPAEVPHLLIYPAEGQTLRLYITTMMTTARKRRPTNTAGALIFACFGDRPSPDKRQWSLIATTTRRRATVKFTPEDAVHKRVWLRACWITPTLRRGRTSQPVAAYIPPAVAADYSARLAA